MTDYRAADSPDSQQQADLRSDDGTASNRDPLEVLLTQFGEEIRLGRAPTIDDYAKRHPDLAEQIRELFPLVHGLEQWKSDREIECMRRNIPTEFSLKKLGDYELIRELGRGGMGVVFQAVHTTSQRSVAIKLLPWRFAADMSVWKDRLQREASTIAALKHPNIVPIYSFSQDQGYSYYVMQLIDGVSLDKMIEQLKLQRRRVEKKKRRVAEPNDVSLMFDSWRGFAGIGEQVAAALAYAHEQGVCHNDIKPSNLLIRPNRQVIVTDFGIGRLNTDDRSDWNDREVGTLKYMAPERLSSPGTTRSDIYSLGATLYELATQTPLFDFQKRAQLIDAIVNSKPVSPRRRRPDIPAPLEKIILKAMAKSPDDRYANARQLAIDLHRFINRQPILSDSNPPWARLFSRFGNWFRIPRSDVR